MKKQLEDIVLNVIIVY